MEREKEFLRLQRQIVRCRRCPRLVEWRERVAREKIRRFKAQRYWGRPVPAFGKPDAALIIVGLAPAAHGGNRTGRMFTGDRSGDWLYDALYRFDFANQPVSIGRDDGLMVHNCLITAALRCAPPGNKPLRDEENNCREYLRREFHLTGNRCVVIALGRIAFHAFLKAWREDGEELIDGKMEFRHGEEWTLPGGMKLISSYHPSRQNTQTGKLTHAMFDDIFRRAREILAGKRG
jgi:uracil-DNA glycosylase family 4